MLAMLRNPGFVFDALYMHAVRKRLEYGCALAAIALALAAVLFVPAFGFPKGAVLEVPADASFRETASRLKEQGIIGSELLFRALARVTSADRDTRSGRYLFEHPQGMAVVLWRLSAGDYGIPAVRVTFPEGITARDMALILGEKLPALDTDAFLRLATPYEGYLFPDTYHFYADATPEGIIERMRSRFDEVWSEVRSGAQGYYEDGAPTPLEPKERIVIMASILEKETKPGEDRNIVSGILWDRIAYGMPLQVDAVFGYIKGIDTYHPSGEDLEIDSPYNTYLHRDLPPGPIGNPGRDALESAHYPQLTRYSYYLTGNDGRMHYAETFEEHKANKERYLR